MSECKADKKPTMKITAGLGKESGYANKWIVEDEKGRVIKSFPSATPLGSYSSAVDFVKKHNAKDDPSHHYFGN